jgi:hypothetical protein
LKPLLFVQILTDSSGVSEAAIVLVQIFPENIQVQLLESAIPFVHKLDLRGVSG